MDKSIINRFWSKVDKTESCWNWIAATSSNGYGAFGYNHSMIGAHRMSWIIHNGDIPSDSGYHNTLYVLHKCDNRKCVNPSHLFLGNNADNLKDMRSKGRGSEPITGKGIDNPSSKLVDKDVIRIRRLYPHLTQKLIGDEYGVSEGCIADILHRRKWKHI